MSISKHIFHFPIILEWHTPFRPLESVPTLQPPAIRFRYIPTVLCITIWKQLLGSLKFAEAQSNCQKEYGSGVKKINSSNNSWSSVFCELNDVTAGRITELSILKGRTAKLLLLSKNSLVTQIIERSVDPHLPTSHWNTFSHLWSHGCSTTLKRKVVSKKGIYRPFSVTSAIGKW